MDNSPRLSNNIKAVVRSQASLKEPTVTAILSVVGLDNDVGMRPGSAHHCFYLHFFVSKIPRDKSGSRVLVAIILGIPSLYWVGLASLFPNQRVLALQWLTSTNEKLEVETTEDRVDEDKIQICQWEQER
jgi:hypothetical protein